MRFFLASTCVTFALLPALVASAASKQQTPKGQLDPLDWPNWRGPGQNRLAGEAGLPDTLDFGEDSKLLAWKSREAAGISTPIIMRGKLYTIVRAEPGNEREQEEVLCLDAASGKKLWGNRFNVFLSDVPAERVGWSCCVGDPTTGRVYAMGVNGYFQCLDGDTGKTIWSRSLSEEFGLLSTYGGRTNVPVLFEDLVIISGVIIGWGEMAKPAHRFLGLDKNSGEVVWFNGTRLLPEDTTYSTPTVTVIDGQSALVFGSGDGGVHAFQPATGKPIWKCQLSRRGINVSPLVVGDKVYIGQSEENTDGRTMGVIACINGKGSGDLTGENIVWQHKEVMVGKSTPLLYDNRLYAVNDSAALYIFDGPTGKPIGRKQKFGTIMQASLLGADGKIYLPTKTTWAILKPAAGGFKKIAQGRLQPEEECQGSPIVSHGRLYWPTTFNLYCFEDKEKKREAEPEAIRDTK